MLRLLDIRRGEGNRFLLSFGVLMLTVGAYTIVKVVRDAIFLANFGVSDLSLIAVGLAVLSGFVVTAYLRLARGASRAQLIAATNLVVVLSLLALWYGLSRPNTLPWLPWVLYVWSSLFGVFMVTQFWLLAGDLFDSREAKRLFGPIGAGAICGGVLGGGASQTLASALGAPTLLLVAAGLLVASTGLSSAAWRLRPIEATHRTAEDKGQGASIGGLRNPSLIRSIAVAFLLFTTATTLLDWQLKSVAKAEFAGRSDEMAAFFGQLFTYLSAAALLMQVLSTGWLLRRFGVGVGRLILPSCLLFGCAFIIGQAYLPLSLLGILAGVKVVESSLRFSVDKTSQELTWLPVTGRQRQRYKSLVDTAGDRLGTGLSGVIWLTLAAFSLDAPYLPWAAVVLAICVVLWLGVLSGVHRRYLEAFRTVLVTRTIDLENLSMGLGRAQAQQVLSQALNDPDPNRVRFALYLLQGWDGPLPDLTSAFERGDSATRTEIIRLLTNKREQNYTQLAQTALQERDPELVEAAVRYLRTTGVGDTEAVEQVGGVGTTASYIRSLLSLRVAATTEEAEQALKHSLGEAEQQRRLELIRMLGAAPAQTAARLLEPLLRHDDPRVTLSALSAAGRAKAHPLALAISPLLSRPTFRARAAAALSDMGAEVLPHLVKRLHDSKTPMAEKTALIRLIGASRDASMAKELAIHMEDASEDVAHAAIRSLARLAARADVSINRELVEHLVQREIGSLYLYLACLNDGSWPMARKKSHEDLLRIAIVEALDATVLRIFRLLSLRYRSSDMMASHRALQSPLKKTRANGVEFLDNVLSGHLKGMLLPALEDESPNLFRQQAAGFVTEPLASQPAIVARLLEGPDRWLRVVATWTAGEVGLESVSRQLQAAAQRKGRSDQALSGEAQRALGKINKTQLKEVAMALTVVEKALKLRTVDVLSHASSKDLGYIAQIAEEQEVSEGQRIYAHGDAPDALYVVISGKVKLSRGDVEIGLIGAGEAFGSWALFDDAPRVATASTTEDSVLLKVERDEFLELLADRVDIVQAVFKAMVEKIRNLADLAQGGELAKGGDDE